MSGVAIAVLLVSVVAFLIGIGSLISVRSDFYEQYGGFSADRPDFVRVALARHKPAIARAVVGLLVGFAGLVGFGLVMRP